MDHGEKIKVEIPMTEPRLNLNVGQEEDHEDRISALPDELLVGILERLDLREALRAGAASTRWRHLPHQLSRLDLAIRHFRHRSGATLRAILEPFALAAQRFLSVCPECEQRGRRVTIKTLLLRFHVVSDADLMRSIGRTVEHVVGRGKTERFEFAVVAPDVSPTAYEYGHHLMSFSRSSPVAFRWLTKLELRSFAFEDPDDIGELIRGCDKLEQLELIYCNMVAPLKIDAPSSGIQALTLFDSDCTQVQLVSLPKLRRFVCDAWLGKQPRVHFGDVPSLREVYLNFLALRGAQTQLALSELLPRNLSILRLSFGRKMIWIQPENPKRLAPIFSNMREVHLYQIFAQCDLNWTLFFLEAAPSLHKFHVSRHSCVSDDAEKTSMSWEPSKNWKHLNLRLMVMVGFLEEDQAVVNYVRLVMERATCLERIELITDKNCCHACNDVYIDPPRKFPAIQASRHRVRERLTQGLSSPAQIMINSILIPEKR